MNTTAALAHLAGAAAPAIPACPRIGGRIAAFDGHTIECSGLDAAVGTVCAIGSPPSPAEVIGFRDGRTLLMGLAQQGTLLPGDPVMPLGDAARVSVGPALLGRVLDGGGRPLDGEPAPLTSLRIPLDPPATNPLNRTAVGPRLDCGVRAIDALLTLGRGQRVGIMAGSGVGKSVLLGQMARGTACDTVVVALIGERGREIGDFLATQLSGPARARSVVVAVAADDAPLLRVRGVMRAHAIAEYFRSLGQSVLLIVDSLTRVAHAQREIGMALGEACGPRGYPPSAIQLLPRLAERAGNDRTSGGSITAIYTVLVDGDDLNDPVVDAARGVLDGHIVLSRAVAQRGIYPAIDIAASISRSMHDLVEPAHARAAAAFRRAHGLVEENRDLVAMGAYAPGHDLQLDAAFAARAAMDGFRSQGIVEHSSGNASTDALIGLELQ
ncbi:FliI/YscN family ATPase [Glacieibacterium sp.]|uniref:FliI/YscN family ATPase n=1 Tax=Glacieibacterium sp. TaxID=2860237 RepID=UPI003AFF6E66